MNGKSLTKRHSLEILSSAHATEPTGGHLNEVQPGSVLDYWQIIYGRKLTLALLATAGLIVAVLVTLPQAPAYRAHTSLEIQDLNQDFVNMKLVSPVAEPTSTNALGDMETQVKILKSDTLIERALEKSKTSLPEEPDSQRSQTPAWRSILHLQQPAPGRDDLIETTAKNLKVNVAGQTRILEIAFEASDPRFAARFTNALASEFIDQKMQARWQMSQHTSEWLGRQLADVRVTLQHSEDALQTYARQNRLLYNADKQNVSEEKLRQLQAELLKAQTDRVSRQSRFEITRSSTADTLPDVYNDSNLRALETTLTDLRRREAELGATFKPDYSKAKKIHAEIETLESAMERERATVVSRINNEFQESQLREKLLADVYGDQVRVVVQDSEKSIQYNILKREVDTNRQIYEAMLHRVKESGIASAMRAANVRVIDPARSPERPFKPNLPINSAVGLLCGAMFGIALIVMQARTDYSLHEPGDAGLLLGLPELGVIPTAIQGENATPCLITLFPKELGSLSPGGAQIATSQAAPSLVADSFRSVLASILLSSSGGNRPQVLVITSAGPHEGKTTAATNLAVALAKIDRKVLLIDGDIRNPRVHELFHLDNSKGVTNLLDQSVVDDPDINGSIQATASPNLSVLTSGPVIHAGSDLLFSASMRGLIARYRKQFDMVIIDTPPMLSMPDARVLGRISDGVVLIARAGSTTRTAILTAFRRLVQDQTPVIGIILNDWKAKSSPYYSYYGPYQKSTTTSVVKAASVGS